MRISRQQGWSHLTIRKPMVVIGGALSQLPEYAALEVKVQALSVAEIEFVQRTLKDSSIILLSQHFSLNFVQWQR